MCIDLINYIVGAIVVLTIGGDDGGGGDGDGQEFAWINERVRVSE